MFPIRWNFPFRKKDGTMSTIGDEIESGGGGGYTLPTASANTKGGVKIGSGLSMDGEVLNNSNPTPYSLPTASSETLGGVKVGNGLSIDDGVLSATGGGGGTQLYYKDFENLTFNSWTQLGETNWYSGITNYLALEVSGYTPLFVVVTDKYSGYQPLATIEQANVSPKWYAISMLAKKASVTNSYNGRVYYMKDSDLTPIPTNVAKVSKSKK